MSNDELSKLLEDILASTDDNMDRLIRVETVLFKLALHMGLNPRTGEPLKDGARV